MIATTAEIGSESDNHESSITDHVSSSAESAEGTSMKSKTSVQIHIQVLSFMDKRKCGMK